MYKDHSILKLKYAYTYIMSYVVYVLLLIIVILIAIAISMQNDKRISGGRTEDVEIGVYFVRHGETNVNVAGQENIRGQPEPLNDKGREQSEITGKYLHGSYHRLHGSQGKPMIYTSPATRSIETAIIIAKHFNIPDSNIITTPLIEEFDSGELSGKSRKADPELFEKSDKLQQAYEKGKDIIEKTLHFDDLDKQMHDEFGIELNSDVTKRVSKFLKSLDKNAIVITHSGVLVVIIRHLTGVHQKIMGDLTRGNNASIMYVRKKPKKDSGRVITLPNTKHLPDVK
jgi:broad specificity phosphatase PhoE